MLIFVEVANGNIVGLRGDLFVCGTESLAARQLIYRVRNVLDAGLSLKLVFQSPDIDGTSAAIRALGMASDGVASGRVMDSRACENFLT